MATEGPGSLGLSTWLGAALGASGTLSCTLRTLGQRGGELQPERWWRRQKGAALRAGETGPPGTAWLVLPSCAGVPFVPGPSGLSKPPGILGLVWGEKTNEGGMDSRTERGRNHCYLSEKGSLASFCSQCWRNPRRCGALQNNVGILHIQKFSEEK